MSLFSFFKRRDESTNGAATATDLLQQARAHAREGRQAQASELYWKLKPKQHDAESLVEHAELLLEMGDYFGAASKANDARQRDPQNARALAVQEEVTRREEAEERKRLAEERKRRA